MVATFIAWRLDQAAGGQQLDQAAGWTASEAGAGGLDGASDGGGVNFTKKPAVCRWCCKLARIAKRGFMRAASERGVYLVARFVCFPSVRAQSIPRQNCQAYR